MKGSCPIITALRERMSKASISALIVPSADSHNSEYVAEQFQRRAFLTQFSGSAGTAVITLDKALLWTDGRYWLEAGSTMYTDFELMKQGKVGVPNVEDWLALHLDSKERVGLFPEVCTIGQWETYAKKIPLQPVEDFVGAMMPPNNTPNLIFERPAQFCGATCMERREALVKKLKESKCDHLLLSALDEVAWLTNLRGSDVPYNPVFYAYALVSAHHPKVKVFVDLRKVTAQIRDTCTSTIDFLPYEAMTSELVSLASAPIGVQPPSFLVDERRTSEAVRQILERAGAVIRRVDCGPAQSLKAVKNEVELDGFRKCHVRDGASLTRYLAWLHEEIAVKGVTTLNEYDAATKLEEYRSVNEHYVQLSFPTISSSGPNAAVVHYQPEPQGSRLLAREELYLVDSGAQYLDGTTDVTRTVCFAPATEFQKEAYTRVLQGHIGLDLSVFPEDLNGVRLDMVARQALWNVGLDYAHGTGHGVGSFLNVHEGPHGVGIRPSAAGIAACSIISNEPGYYKDGEFGIRIENLDEIVPRPTKYSSAGFLGLRYLTMAPLCRELILAEMLTGEQREWVNTYHATVKERLLPLLRDQWKDDRAVEYLNHHTTPI